MPTMRQRKKRNPTAKVGSDQATMYQNSRLKDIDERSTALLFLSNAYARRMALEHGSHAVSVRFKVWDIPYFCDLGRTSRGTLLSPS